MSFSSYLKEKIDAADPSAPLGTPNNPSSKVLTVANVITVCRIALTLVFLYLFVNRYSRPVCLIIYGIAASTDFLDGTIARATQTVSWVGKLLDPVVDRFLLFSGVIGLCVVGELPIWIPLVVVGRDVVLAIGAVALRRYRTRPIDVLYIGKVATALLLIGFCWLLLNVPVINGFGLVHATWLPLLNTTPACAGMLVVYIGVICSVITGCLYILEGILIYRRAKRGEATQ